MILDQLKNENTNANAINSKKDEHVAVLETAKDKLAKELEAKQSELIKLEDELRIEKAKKEREKEDNKLMIKYLLTERKELFITLQRMRLELNHKSTYNYVLF